MLNLLDVLIVYPKRRFWILYYLGIVSDIPKLGLVIDQDNILFGDQDLSIKKVCVNEFVKDSSSVRHIHYNFKRDKKFLERLEKIQTELQNFSCFTNKEIYLERLFGFSMFHHFNECLLVFIFYKLGLLHNRYIAWEKINWREFTEKAKFLHFKYAVSIKDELE
jgi:hypothetical protein